MGYNPWGHKESGTTERLHFQCIHSHKVLVVTNDDNNNYPHIIRYFNYLHLCKTFLPSVSDDFCMAVFLDVTFNLESTPTM